MEFAKKGRVELRTEEWLQKPSYFSVTYSQLHTALFGNQAQNIYKQWTNNYAKKADHTYGFSGLTSEYFSTLINNVNLSIPLHFIVEVGSFMGKSTTTMAQLLKMDKKYENCTRWPSNCLQQFVANIVDMKLTEMILPFSTTSILGARFLQQHKFFPQLIYLDSAHLPGETLVELELYWQLLQPGGILFGDDWGWDSVRCDVLRFIDTNRLKIAVKQNSWSIQKPILG
ncbi:unnamed protein product [Didymodactylos carnosus]|uniref:Methyltransferase n=1 Tax=Didymodactylos carnosus TaxID=1234261 RepID=A0A814SC99_9BILA|nr:unnamed protein product [Didymodactylos carnosus]CAF3908915.1 unnamed protein product [Didymodactylos carnosus]